MSERTIFLEALDISDPAQRQAFLDRVCAGDAGLRGGVEALLAAHQRDGSFLDSPAFEPVATSAESETRPVAEGPGTRIGAYRLLEQIGEGGMGAVWMAQQQQPVRRLVALKVIKPGMDSAQVIARFEAERQALAIMDHPNIARVLEAGSTESGRPFFVMELVRGVPITRYCDDNKLTPRQRLELFVLVCQAIQHAHTKGIIHRDIKPSNVLVTLHDGKAVVKVIDFGIAKAIGQELTERTLLTGFAQMIGTPLYMSPEQAGLSGLDIDTRSDVYSLGVLLYELLTGTTPFDQERLAKAGYDEMRRIIREEEPPRPSTRLSTLGHAADTISTQRQSDPKRLRQVFRGELDWIVMKALEKDRNRRYESPSAFTADVQRYLREEPVLACPPSAWYRFKKFTRRNRAALAMATVVVLVALVLAGGAGWGLQERAGRRAQTARSVEAALAASSQYQRQGWPSEALAAGRRAREALATGEAEPALHQRVQERLHDLEMWAKVESVRRRKVERMESWISYGRLGTWEFHRRERSRSASSPVDADLRVDDEMTEAFAEYGIPVEKLDAQEAGMLICQRSIAVELAAALHDWALWRQAARPKDTSWKHLLAVASAADPDEWRTRLRAAVAKKDRLALEKLADQGTALSLPVASQVLLADALVNAGAGEKAVAFLRKAQRQHPGEYLLNIYLANNLHWKVENSRPGEALPFYSAALAARPRDAWAHGGLASALWDKGDLDEALAAYDRALALDPDLFLAHMGRAGVLDDQGRYDEAVTACKRASRLRPRDSCVPGCLGVIYAQQKKFDEAVAALKQAISLQKNDATAHFNLGMVLRAKKSPADAVAAFREADRLRPGDFLTLMGLGQALHDKGDRAEALAVFRQAFRLRPRQARALLEIGATLRSRGLREEAITAFREAIRLEPGLADAHASLGDELRKKGQLDKAAVAYREAIRLRPSYAMAHHNLGHVLADQRMFDEALFHYREAIRLKPDLAGAYVSLGIVLCDKRDYEGAVAAFTQAIRLKPNDDVACENLGVALTRKGDHAGAIIAFRKAIRLRPGDGRLHCKLGDAYAARQAVDDAIAAYRDAIRLKPDLFGAHFGLGKMLADSDAPRDAIGPLQKAAELRPDHDLSHAYLGDVLQSAGRPDEAVKAYGKALQLRRKLVADCPQVAAYRSQLGATLNNLALLLAHKSQTRAVALLEEAVRHQKAALKLGPEAPHYRPFLRNHYRNLADILLRLGEHRKAARAAVLLTDLDPDGWQEAVHAAGFLARCAALAAKDTSLPADRRQELVEAAGHEAVALLRRALDRGWKDRAALEAPVFEPLRPRHDFQKLLAATKGPHPKNREKSGQVPSRNSH